MTASAGGKERRTYTLLTADRADGWLVRVGFDPPFTWWFGPHRGTGGGSGRMLSRMVAVFDCPADARAAMREVGWRPGTGGAVIVPLGDARRQLDPDEDRTAPTRQLGLAL